MLPAKIAFATGSGGRLYAKDIVSGTVMYVPNPLGSDYSGQAAVATADVNGDNVEYVVLSRRRRVAFDTSPDVYRRNRLACIVLLRPIRSRRPMRSTRSATRLPCTTSHTAPFHGLRILSREPWFRNAVWRAAAAACIASASGCGHETASPNSDELMIYVAGPGLGVFELDSIQFAAGFSGGPRLRAGAVTWSVSSNALATVSADGLVKAIRATDFDLPVDPSPSAQPTVNAQSGTHTASMALQIFGWKKPRAPELDGVAYLHDEQSFTMTFPFTALGIDQAGELFSGTGTLVLACGTVTAGHWTVEVSPDDVDYPLIAPTRKLFSTDTVSVAFDGEAPRLERWQRVGIRLRATDGDNMVRRMLRARRLAVTAQSYTSQSYVYDGSVKFGFRLGNLEQVTQAAVFRACK